MWSCSFGNECGLCTETTLMSSTRSFKLERTTKQHPSDSQTLDTVGNGCEARSISHGAPRENKELPCFRSSLKPPCTAPQDEHLDIVTEACTGSFQPAPRAPPGNAPPFQTEAPPQCQTPPGHRSPLHNMTKPRDKLLQSVHLCRDVSLDMVLDVTDNTVSQTANWF